ncbi:pitrilysin family protein [Dyadobacter sp. CY312]|uniref:M16 family metallopeptidase n=1 Tax=Dyadobacter sp. CY312 TaxID=2907303 RepID=UPI001F2835E7|nr:pitrilysin family protein [Dyadobacter sp. CY312]MCE7041006.1 insulinase family protein [Dyadobacter sp. CY312]
MFPDRTIAPDFKIINSIHLPETKNHLLDNGTQLHVINIGEQPVVRLECIFEAGNWQEETPGAAFFAIKMLPEGTPDFTSAEISEAFDRIGAFTDFTNNSDRTGITVYCLSRFLPEVLPLVKDMMQKATFPVKELEDLRNITLQNLRVNKEKTSYLATVEFRKGLFGSDHPYGQSQNETDLEELKLEQITEHYDRFIKNGHYTVVLAGQVQDGDIAVVKEYLGKDNALNEPSVALPDTPVDYRGNAVLIEKEDGVQSTIRIGRRMFTRHHPDYFKMLVTNEILGGYFGSRLMKNIREEKGLTYGISSHLITLRNDGYFMIGTDVKKEFTQQTIDEIKKEINKLRTELVGAEELQTVKNFMAGEFAGSLNTAFEVADRRKILLLDGLPSDFFNRYIDQIHATTSEDILEMAKTYLNPDDMLEVVVGGK